VCGCGPAARVRIGAGRCRCSLEFMETLLQRRRTSCGLRRVMDVRLRREEGEWERGMYAPWEAIWWVARPVWRGWERGLMTKQPPSPPARAVGSAGAAPAAGPAPPPGLQLALRRAARAAAAGGAERPAARGALQQQKQKQKQEQQEPPQQQQPQQQQLPSAVRQLPHLTRPIRGMRYQCSKLPGAISTASRPSATDARAVTSLAGLHH
jgi:hypothetical protein